MDTTLQILKYLGISLVASGFILEILVTCAAAFYALRRHLPWSPFTILSAGGVCFFSGLAALALAMSMES